MTVRRNRVFLATCGSLGAVLFATALVGMASRGVVETMHIWEIPLQGCGIS